MSSSVPPAVAPAPDGEACPNHLRRFLTIWIVASLIAVPLVAIVLGPNLPPGKGSDAAAGQVTVELFNAVGNLVSGQSYAMTVASAGGTFSVSPNLQ